MIDGLLVLTLLSVAAVLSCFRFAGCVLPSYQSGPETPDYGDTVKGEASLLAYWRLGEGALTQPGDTAKDEKALQDGEYSSAVLLAGVQSAATAGVLQAGLPTIVAGAPSRTSVKVDGGYVRVAFNDALNPPADKEFSVEAWVLPEWSPTETDVFRCVVASRDDTGPNNPKLGYILYAGPSLDPAIQDSLVHWQAWVGDGTATWVMLVGPPVEVGQTTYLLLTYDGLNQPPTLTLDAITANTQNPRLVRPNTTYSRNSGKPLYIGMGATEIMVPPGPPMYPFLGRLQEIAFYDKALTEDRVAAHVAAGTGQ